MKKDEKSKKEVNFIPKYATKEEKDQDYHKSTLSIRLMDNKNSSNNASTHLDSTKSKMGIEPNQTEPSTVKPAVLPRSKHEAPVENVANKDLRLSAKSIFQSMIKELAIQDVEIHQRFKECSINPFQKLIQSKTPADSQFQTNVGTIEGPMNLHPREKNKAHFKAKLQRELLSGIQTSKTATDKQNLYGLPFMHSRNNSITINMSNTQYPHQWGQMKLIKDHHPPWKQIDPYEREEDKLTLKERCIIGTALFKSNTWRWTKPKTVFKPQSLTKDYYPPWKQGHNQSDDDDVSDQETMKPHDVARNYGPRSRALFTSSKPMSLLKEYHPPWKRVTMSDSDPDEEVPGCMDPLKFNKLTKSRISYSRTIQQTNGNQGQGTIYQIRPYNDAKSKNSSKSYKRTQPQLPSVMSQPQPLLNEKNYGASSNVAEVGPSVNLPPMILPYPEEYSNLKKGFKPIKPENVIRDYPRPWADPSLTAGTGLKRIDFEEKDARACRVLKALWNKDEEKSNSEENISKIDKALYVDNEEKDFETPPPSELSPELKIINRLIKEVYGDNTEEDKAKSEIMSSEPQLQPKDKNDSPSKLKNVTNIGTTAANTRNVQEIYTVQVAPGSVSCSSCEASEILDQSNDSDSSYNSESGISGSRSTSETSVVTHTESGNVEVSAQPLTPIEEQATRLSEQRQNSPSLLRKTSQLTPSTACEIPYVLKPDFHYLYDSPPTSVTNKPSSYSKRRQKAPSLPTTSEFVPSTAHEPPDILKPDFQYLFDSRRTSEIKKPISPSKRKKLIQPLPVVTSESVPAINHEVPNISKPDFHYLYKSKCKKSEPNGNDDLIRQHYNNNFVKSVLLKTRKLARPLRNYGSPGSKWKAVKFYDSGSKESQKLLQSRKSHHSKKKKKVKNCKQAKCNPNDRVVFDPPTNDSALFKRKLNIPFLTKRPMSNARSTSLTSEGKNTKNKKSSKLYSKTGFMDQLVSNLNISFKKGNVPFKSKSKQRIEKCKKYLAYSKRIDNPNKSTTAKQLAPKCASRTSLMVLHPDSNGILSAETEIEPLIIKEVEEVLPTKLKKSQKLKGKSKKQKNRCEVEVETLAPTLEDHESHDSHEHEENPSHIPTSIIFDMVLNSPYEEILQKKYNNNYNYETEDTSKSFLATKEKEPYPLKSRMTSAPPDIHLDFSPSLENVRIPTAIKCDALRGGCKSFTVQKL